MLRVVRNSLTVLMLLTLLLSSSAGAASMEKTIPTFSILNSIPDVSVTIRTYNFPASDVFDVLMGYIGTHGINGIKVATITSGSGGSFTTTFSIPASLRGLTQLALRLQSASGSGYFAYNWFYNTSSGIGGHGYPFPHRAYPTFWIASVIRDNRVTIVTQNLPARDRFQVLMGPIGAHGINGVTVTTINSGNGGAQTMTFDIPPLLYGANKIAIRLQSISGSGYYAYNWFFNTSTH